jgi:hypothetical protein
MIGLIILVFMSALPSLVYVLLILLLLGKGIFNLNRDKVIYFSTAMTICNLGYWTIIGFAMIQHPIDEDKLGLMGIVIFIFSPMIMALINKGYLKKHAVL